MGEGFTLTIHHRSGAPVTQVSFGASDNLVIGRNGAVDIVLDDPSIARRHAVLSGGPGRVRIEVQGGSPAIINGQQTNRAELAPPARVLLGDFALDVTPGRQARQAFRIQRASAEEKLAWAEGACKHLAVVFKGRAVSRPDERGQIESWELQLAVGGRPVRIQLDDHWLTPTTEAKVQNSRGMMFLIHDPEAVPIVAEANDQWGEARPDDRIFLGPNIYTPDTYSTVGVWNSLSERARYDLVTFIKRHSTNGVLVKPDVVSILSTRALSESPRIEATVGEMIRFVVQLAGMFEGDHQWIGFTAGDPGAGGALYNQPPAYRGPPVDCTYCNSSCLLNERSMCPNCGAPLRVS